MTSASVERKTKETDIRAKIAFPGTGQVSIKTTVPFFDHMLTALFFHGGFDAEISAEGDTDIDNHHLVEDTGIVVGQCLADINRQNFPLFRYGHSSIPMDDAAATVLVDFCGRPYLIYNTVFPQVYCGSFEVCLLKEFFQALSCHAKINLHINGLYGENSHHLAEAVFKALGKALGQALTPRTDGILPSTKGLLEE
ncbi:MAG: imidazoleglycerol-phosphate dehydratase HisB [Spirochaetia bacterium]|nr:imidazoleglycerol-phosphate dehydratase HisB [Spirochaetia bacterium]